MAEKTEQPTPRRLREARKKGQIAFSPEVPAAATFLAGVMMLAWWVPRVAREFKTLFTAATEAAGRAGTDPVPLTESLGRQAATAGLRVMGPLVLALALAGIALSLAQAGFHLAPSRLVPSLDKLSPSRTLKRWFSMEGAKEVLKAALKLAVVLALGYATVTSALGAILALHRASLPAISTTLGEAARSFVRAVELNVLDAFPSGHTSVVLIVLAFGWRLLPKWRLPLATVVASILFSTVYLSYHYFVDLLAGALIALFMPLLAPLAPVFGLHDTKSHVQSPSIDIRSG